MPVNQIERMIDFEGESRIHFIWKLVGKPPGHIPQDVRLAANKGVYADNRFRVLVNCKDVQRQSSTTSQKHMVFLTILPNDGQLQFRSRVGTNITFRGEVRDEVLGHNGVAEGRVDVATDGDGVLRV